MICNRNKADGAHFIFLMKKYKAYGVYEMTHILLLFTVYCNSSPLAIYIYIYICSLCSVCVPVCVKLKYNNKMQ